MTTLFKKSLILIFLFGLNNAHADFASEVGMGVYQQDYESDSEELNRLQKEKGALDKKLASCQDTVGAAKWCKNQYGRWDAVMKSELNKISDASKKLGERIETLGKRIFEDGKAADRKGMDSNAKAAFEKYTTRADALLTKKKVFDAELRASGAEMKAIYSSLSQSVLGDYVSYVAKEYGKSKEMKDLICKTASTCGGIAAKQDMEKLSSRIMKWEEFDNERRKTLNAAPVQPTPADPSVR